MSTHSWSYKITKAFVEGKFISKSLAKIRRDSDRFLGIIARKIVFSRVKVKKNKIFFMTFQGDYTCNPKYITEELLRQNVNCDIVWGARLSTLRNTFLIPEKVRLVDRYTYEYYEELASSKVWVINSVEMFKNPLYKTKEQVLIETWHGSLGIKRFDKRSNSGKAWVKAATLCGKMTDYCISNSEFEDTVFRETFWDKNEILKYGHPRNDILFLRENDKRRIDIVNRIRKQYGLLEQQTRYILYGPTFRDDHNFDAYKLDYHRVIESAEKKFGGRWKILVRFHPTVRDVSHGLLPADNEIIDVTDYPDIQEIILFADMAITDYSSWIYDFVLTKKPGFIFATDIKKYNTERGFYYKLETTPFPVATNNDKLIENIEKFDASDYRKNVDLFLSEKGCMEDGNASIRVVNKIKEIVGENE